MVERFSVAGFRNLKQINLAINAPLVLFYGANGQGKTNVLEAISIAACGSSFRPEAKDFMLPFNAENIHFSEIQLALNSGEKHKVILSQSLAGRVQMKFWQNEVVANRSEFIGSIPVVVFEPQDMNIFYDDPSARRNFLDNVLIQLFAPYRQAYSQAKRVLMNRNHLLKAIQKGSAKIEELSFWDKQYAEISSVIQNYRQRLVDDLLLAVPVFYEHFANIRMDLWVEYKPSVFDAEKYNVPERARGFTLSGQHRDDMLVTFNHKPWQAIASRGEMRTLILALKASVVRYFSHHSEQRPILLLDDIFSELDTSRRQLILDWKNDYQIFLTTAADLPEAKQAQVFTIESGAVIDGQS